MGKIYGGTLLQWMPTRYSRLVKDMRNKLEDEHIHVLTNRFQHVWSTGDITHNWPVPIFVPIPKKHYESITISL